MRLAAALAILAAAASAPAGDDAGGGPRAVPLAKPETVYRMLVPGTADSLLSSPLLVVLHGANDTSDRFIDRWVGPAGARGWILVAPQARGLRWLDADGDIVLAALEDARKRCRVDPARVCLAGAGSGGLMATRWGLEQKDRFACVFAHGGLQVRGGLKESAGKVSVLLSCGERDEFLEEARSADAELRKAGVDSEVATWPGAEGDAAGPEVVERAFSFFEERLARPAARLARCVRARKEKRWPDAARECAALLGEGVERKFRLEAENERRAIEYAGADLVRKAALRAGREPAAGRKDLEDLARAFEGLDAAVRAREALAEIDAASSPPSGTPPAGPR